jgi:hypothetical protein
MSEDGIPDYSGKVLVIYHKDRSDGSASLIDEPVFELIGDRYFLVGIIPKGGTQNDWGLGAVTAIALDNIAEYYVLDRNTHEETLRNSHDVATKQKKWF